MGWEIIAGVTKKLKDVQDWLTSQRGLNIDALTTTRAAKLDHLTGNVALASNYTSTRAGYLDNLTDLDQPISNLNNTQVPIGGIVEGAYSQYALDNLPNTKWVDLNKVHYLSKTTYSDLYAITGNWPDPGNATEVVTPDPGTSNIVLPSAATSQYFILVEDSSTSAGTMHRIDHTGDDISDGVSWSTVTYPCTDATVATQVWADRENEAGLVLLFSNTDGIYRSTDHGSTWSTAGGSIIAAETKCFFAQAGDGYIYAYSAAEASIYRSNNSGLTWSLFGDSPYTDIAASELYTFEDKHNNIRYINGTLYAATGSSGIYGVVCKWNTTSSAWELAQLSSSWDSATYIFSDETGGGINSGGTDTSLRIQAENLVTGELIYKYFHTAAVNLPQFRFFYDPIADVAFIAYVNTAIHSVDLYNPTAITSDKTGNATNYLDCRYTSMAGKYLFTRTYENDARFLKFPYDLDTHFETNILTHSVRGMSYYMRIL